MKPIIYVAHPVSGDVRENCTRAIRWLRWLSDVDPTRIYVAPWVGEVLAHLDLDPVPTDFYDRVLSDDEEVVARLDGIVLTGIGDSGPYRRANGFMKSAGMTRETAASALSGGVIFDLSHFSTAEDAQQEFASWNGALSGSDYINIYRIQPKPEDRQ